MSHLSNQPRAQLRSYRVRAVHLGDGTRAQTYDVGAPRVIQATSGDEACVIAERTHAGTVAGVDWYFADAQCDDCGVFAEDTAERTSGAHHCGECHRAALAYGHLHTDHDPYAADCAECPLCAQERSEDQRIAQRLNITIEQARGMGR